MKGRFSRIIGFRSSLANSLPNSKWLLQMTDKRKGIQSVEQGVKILESLINSRSPLPLKVLARQAGMSPSMAHRYLASFIRAELVHQDSVSGHYDLGTFALRLGMAALNRADLIQIADDEFRQLVSRVNVDGHLTVWGDYGATIVRVHNRAVPILSDLRLGTVLSLIDSAAGRVFLTFLNAKTTRANLKSELARMDEPKPTTDELASIQTAVRAQGYAWIDGQVFHSMRALAAPIFDTQGGVRAVMSLVSNQASLVKFPNTVLDDLIATARRTSQRLGWQSDTQQPQPA
jgi:DNA-binding IclR family transcriptional regulator